MYFVCVWVRLNEQLNVFVEILITHGRERKKWNGERQEENLCVHLEPDDENKNALKSSYTHTSFQANKQNRVSSSLHQQQQQQRCKQRPPSLLHFLCVYGWNRSGRVWMHPFSGSTTVCCCACIVLVLYHHHCRRHRHRCLQTLTGKCTYLPTAYTRLIKREKAKKIHSFDLNRLHFFGLLVRLLVVVVLFVSPSFGRSSLACSVFQASIPTRRYIILLQSYLTLNLNRHSRYLYSEFRQCFCFWLQAPVVLCANEYKNWKSLQF